MQKDRFSSGALQTNYQAVEQISGSALALPQINGSASAQSQVKELVLASASPRRRKILEDTGFTLRIMPANVDETRLPNENPQDLVRRLACKKARAVAEEILGNDSSNASSTVSQTCVHNLPILAADTIVWLPTGEVLGKPTTPQEAHAMLEQLSGKTHCVSTGACIIFNNQEKSLVETAKVTFYPLTSAQIQAYVSSGEPLDKAGAYGIQGAGRLLIKQIEGDFFCVMGLPLARVVRELLAPLTSQDLIEQILNYQSA